MNSCRDGSPPDVIRVERLCKSYGRIRAVVDVSFHVAKGEIFGFLGPNGAGKTTTLNILEGLKKADGGRVTILGMDIDKDAKTIKRRIGVQLQTTSLLPELTVFELVELFARLYGLQPSRNEVQSLLRQVGLSTKSAVAPDHLSGGQKQRLALALALVNRPEIVFLDEPTTGLDPQSRRALWALIRELRRQGKTVVLTTHYMEEAESLCDRVGIIDQGRLVALDTPPALISRLAGVSSITTSAFLPEGAFHGLPQIVGLEREGALLRLQTREVAPTLRTILELCDQHEVKLNDLHITQPNLEDVFLSLTGHAIRD
jgi:ABC-2 type transport system ATP-binding protein